MGRVFGFGAFDLNFPWNKENKKNQSKTKNPPQTISCRLFTLLVTFFYIFHFFLLHNIFSRIIYIRKSNKYSRKKCKGKDEGLFEKKNKYKNGKWKKSCDSL
jgi:hypothetical protein